MVARNQAELHRQYVISITHGSVFVQPYQRKEPSVMATFTRTRATPADSGIKRLFVAHPLTAYFVLAFGLMWLFVLPLGLSRSHGSSVLPYDLSEGLGNALYLLGTFIGPTVAALIVSGVTDGRAGVGRLLKRFIQWRVRPRWYLVALGINLMIWLLAYAALMGPELLVAAASHWSLLLSTFLPLVAFGMIIPSIAEEPGWRGFALPRLQQRHGPVVALWHLPALMTKNFGPLPLANYVPFMLTAALATVIYTWVYNRTGGSVLLAILLHAASNATAGWLTTLLAEIGTEPPTAGLAGFLASTIWINVIAYGLVALILIVTTRGRLGYRQQP
jgi:uncharacterized protein